jgi:hypothetical protein
MPVIYPRKSVTLLNARADRELDALGLSVEDVYRDTAALGPQAFANTDRSWLYAFLAPTVHPGTRDRRRVHADRARTLNLSLDVFDHQVIRTRPCVTISTRASRASSASSTASAELPTSCTWEHPDDEDSALIAMLAQGDSARRLLVSHARRRRSEPRHVVRRFRAWGVSHLESMQARTIDGGESWFGPFYDYDYSKSGAETLEKWGKDRLVAEISGRSAPRNRRS